MLESLKNIDYQLFRYINHDMSNGAFDLLMPLIRNMWTWVPLYIGFIYLCFKTGKQKGLFIIFGALLIVLFADQISSGLMKPYFERLRPCHDPLLADSIITRINCGGQFGFVSSHAANHFGLAVLFSWFFRRITDKKWIGWLFFAWAFLISFAQIYVGKHFPGDVLIGGILGAIIGLTLTHFVKIIFKPKQE